MKSAAALLLPAILSAQIAQFRLRETAGLRRFSYPVRASFATTHSPDDLRLLDQDKPVPAQFTQREAGVVEVDFNASPAPFETRQYSIEDGAGPPPGEGVSVVETASTYLVKRGQGLEFEVPKNLLGFLSTVRTPRRNYLRAGSPGLRLIYRDDIGFRAGGIGHWGAPTQARVTKTGPLAAALRFESTEGLRGDRSVASAVEMEFPRSKSWVEVTWTVDDPLGFVKGLEAELDLELTGPPVLADFGAGSVVYAALAAGQSALFTAGPSGWSIGLAGAPYASGSGRVEGWAHVMDRERATAIGVDEIGRFDPYSSGAIEITSAGRLAIRREFTRGQRKSLHFWLHFVGMPVQVGAATSPQSMMQPPAVEWK